MAAAMAAVTGLRIYPLTLKLAHRPADQTLRGRQHVTARRPSFPVSLSAPRFPAAETRQPFLALPARGQSTRSQTPSAYAGSGDAQFEEEEDQQEAMRRAQASKRVERASKYFRRLGMLGFWGQLVCTVVAAVILTFSIVISGRPTAPVSTYLTSGGIVAAFLSVFWSFGYLRLAERLRAAVDNPMKAPPRATVVANLKNGLVINLLGLGATLIGLQATVGVLVAKALTSTAPIYGAVGTPAGYNPVLALDVFLVQASGNTALSHFLGLVLTLELLRATTLAQPPPEGVLPKPA